MPGGTITSSTLDRGARISHVLEERNQPRVPSEQYKNNITLLGFYYPV